MDSCPLAKGTPRGSIPRSIGGKEKLRQICERKVGRRFNQTWTPSTTSQRRFNFSDVYERYRRFNVSACSGFFCLLA
ncbi:hypothetical protein SUGI_0676890 [Cryptomeria japonica]|nr:hypothetical protein SUGI_0676890 [Cryptomeria japonica]